MGFFSWHTQDTQEPIYNIYQSHSSVFPVYMVNPNTGEYYKEERYEGYGEFGGKDFYALLAELNKDKIGDIDWSDIFEVRNAAIDIAFENFSNGEDPDLVYPILVRNLESWKNYIGEIPAGHSGQGFWKE